MSATTKFWQDFRRVAFKLERDGLFIAAYLVDNKTNAVEIHGETCLRSLLFNASPQINSEWVAKSVNRNVRGWDADLPEGALPYLPVGGIEDMTWTVLELYWPIIMNIVLKDRQGKMQYDSHK